MQVASESWEREGNELLPSSLQKEYSPTDTLILDFRLLGCDRINVYCFKTPTLLLLVVLAIGNDYHMKCPALLLKDARSILL